VSWHSARLLGKTVSGTDLETGWGWSEQFAESALDTLCAARNRADGAGFARRYSSLRIVPCAMLSPAKL
jgi:hypothetical protein